MAGNLIRVDTPIRQPHGGGILDIANVQDVPDNARIAAGGVLEWDANACGLMVAAPGMCEPPADWPTAAKEATDSASAEGGIAFPGYYGVECFYGPDDTSEEIAIQGITDGEGVFVDQIVAGNILATAASGGTGTDLLDAFAKATAAVAAGYPTGLGVLLMDHISAVKLFAAGALVGKTGTPQLFTPTGNPVAALSMPLTDTVVAGAIFATGAITVLRSPIHTFDGQDLAHNTHLRIAERSYAVYFDCLQPVKFTVSAG